MFYLNMYYMYWRCDYNVVLEKNGIKINEQSSFNISYGKYMLVEIIKDDRTPNERKVYSRTILPAKVVLNVN